MPGKKKKAQPESESEENSEKEESEEEAEEGSEEEEEEDKGSDEEEDEGSSEEKSEKSDKSKDSEGSEKSEKSSKSSKSGSSDGSKSSSDKSDSSGKKAKKKKGKKDKKKSDKGKDKKKDQPVEKNKKGSPKDNLPLDPPAITIASVFQDLEELSSHLARTFSTFQAKEEVNNTQKQQSPLLKYPSPPESPGKELTHTRGPLHQNASLPVFNHNENAKPLTEDTGVQYGAESNVRRHASPEARRAVQEYKQKKEQEKKIRESPEEPVGLQNDRTRSQNRHREDQQKQFDSTWRSGHGGYEQNRREERKGEQEEMIDFKKRTISPKKTGSQGSRFNQIAEDYYASLYKKSAKNPPSGQKTIQDLYKYKPKPMFVEDESQPIAPYNESEFNIPKSRPAYDTYDPRLKPQNENTNDKYNPLRSNKKQISDAMDILSKRGRNNPNY